MTVWHAVAAGVVVIALSANLDGYPLLEPDEGRNAEVAREMAASNDYVLPQLNGLPYLDKPVLYFAATAGMMELLGPTALAARLPSLLFTLGTLGVVAWFARRRFGADGAWAAAVATAAAPLTLGFARTVIFDSALTFVVVVALVSFYEATEGRYGGKAVRSGGEELTAQPPYRPTAAWRWSALAWAAMAFGVLTKGPIALALPLLVAIPYALWRRSGRALWEPVGPLLFVAIVLPWVLAVSRRIPDFLQYALVTETFVRLTTDQLHRTEPLWYFGPILLAGALPWTVVVLAGWREARPLRTSAGAIDARTVFLLLWIAIPFVLFTLSQSKRPQYMVPLVPAVGLLVARVWEDRRSVPGAAAIAGVIAALGVGIAAFHSLVPGMVPTTTEIRAALPGTALAIGGATAGAAVVPWVWRARPPVALLGLALPVSTIPLAGDRLMDAIGRDRSAALIAEAVAPVLDDENRVLAIAAFPLSLPFYLRRTVLLASADGSELTSNYLTRASGAQWIKASHSPVHPLEWWREALDGCLARVFLARSDDGEVRRVLAARLPLLIETRKYAAYGPCGAATLARREPTKSPDRGTWSEDP